VFGPSGAFSASLAQSEEAGTFHFRWGNWVRLDRS